MNTRSPTHHPLYSPTFHPTGGKFASGGGENLAVLSFFVDTIEAGGANSIFEETSNSVHIVYDTDDGFGSVAFSGPLTLDDGDTLTWNGSASIPQSNFNSARMVVFAADTSRITFGLVYDSSNKIGITRFNSSGVFQGHTYLQATFAASEWFRVYIPSAGGNMVFQISSDGISFTTLATFGITISDIAITANHSTTAASNEISEFFLFNMFKGIGDAPT